jgi:hypothetical protein
MKLSSFRPDVADAAMLAVVLMWAANNILIKGAQSPHTCAVFARRSIAAKGAPQCRVSAAPIR